jgi:hypothetical protein
MKANSGSHPTLSVAVGLATVAVVIFGIALTPARAQDDDGRGPKLRAVPFVFVGDAGDCGEFPVGSGAPYPPGANLVTSAWLGGMGLPDNGGANVGAVVPIPTPNRTDPRLGLLLSKNGSSADCSVGGARIRGVRGMIVDAAFELGFDYRNGSHCGVFAPESGTPPGGASPRFVVIVEDPDTRMQTRHSVDDCDKGSNTSSQQDPGQWTTITWTAAQAIPPIPPGSRIHSITLLYDEGTDRPSATPTSQDASSIGLAVLDNLNINGEIIRSGRGIADHDNGKDHEDDDRR